MNEERIEAYLERVPPCVEGQGGDDHLFRVACLLRQRFSLDEEQIFEWLKHFNEKCQPSWSEDRLAYKAREAVKARMRIEGVIPPRLPTQKTIFLRKPRLEDYQVPSQATDATATSLDVFHINVQTKISSSRSMLENTVASVAVSGGMEGTLQNIVREHDGCLALDIETYAELRLGKHGKVLKSKDALSSQKGDIRLVQMADSSGGIVVRDLRERPLDCGERDLLRTQELIAHNVAFELRFLGTKLGIVANSVFCTMTASKLLLPGREFSHKLGDVLERHLGVKIPKDLGSSDWGAMLLTEEQMEYARNDVRYLHRLKDKLAGELKEAKLEKVFEMECRLILVTAAMEVHGFAIDSGAMRALKAVSDTSAANLAAQIRQDFGNEKLNPASPLQLVKAFTEAGEKLENVDEETLMGLEDPRARTILSYRTAAKLSSNIETLLKAEHHGRIHSIFNPFGATTGRFSSKEPNLQNVTKGPLRACFVPSELDRKLIVADYSQIELRVAALVARDTVMIEAFRTGEDLHFKTASSALGRAATKQERAQVGKATNFGFLYGQGPPGFVRYARTNYELMLSLDEAKVFHGRFFLLYAGLKKWHSRCWELAEDPANNTARTIFGRLLMPDGDRPWNRFVMFTNYRVQGSCADLIKAAMLKTTAILPLEVRLVATVHDELIFDAPADTARQHCSVIEQAMIDAFVEMFGETVPVEVEADVYDNWGEKK